MMERKTVQPRTNWQSIVESQGLHYHTIDDQVYWDESTCYCLDAKEIDALEKATYELDGMCLAAVAHVIKDNLFEHFAIPACWIEFITHSWEHDEQTVYGRMDFSFNGGDSPRLLEYNADTPTALLEAAVIQWFWLKDTHPNSDQFNSIHERLIEVWTLIKSQGTARCYFTSLRGQLEDYMTVNYLRDTAIQAGIDTDYIHIEDIGWNERECSFVDLDENALPALFKLYPWEWMLQEKFSPCLQQARTRFLEPPWKMLLANKAILVVLWELFPDSPYLLRAAFEPFGDTYVKKPIQGREGANVSMVVNGQTVIETEGPYTSGPWVCQEVKPLPKFDGRYPVLGSWLVNGYACGLGIREDNSPVTRNTSRFVPHVIAT
jgi:glutathionylspermidine synthase